MAALMLLAVSCKKDPKVGTPSVKTLEATETAANSALLNAKINFAGVNFASVNYGFYWGTSEDPEGTYTMGEGVLSDNGLYSAVITGLAPETEYWFKAYVEIDDVPYTGETLSFTTAVSPVPEEAVDLGIVMTRGDGTRYKLYWAKSNLSESGLCANPEDYGDYYAWGETEPYYVPVAGSARILAIRASTEASGLRLSVRTIRAARGTCTSVPTVSQDQQRP